MSDPTTSNVKNYNPFISPSSQPSSQRSFDPSNSFSSPKPNSPDVHVAAASFPQEPPAAGQCARVGSFLGLSSGMPKASPPPAQASSFLPPRQPVSTTPVPFQVPTTEPIKRNGLVVSVFTSPATDTKAKTEPSVRVEEKAPEPFEILKVIRIKEEENLNKEEDNDKQRKGAAFTFGLKCACGRFYEILYLP